MWNKCLVKCLVSSLVMFGEIFDETIIFAQLMSYYNHLYIKEVDINDRCVTDLSEYFYCCESLESIIIPKFVESIGDYAFHKCEKLKFAKFLNECSVISIGNNTLKTI